MQRLLPYLKKTQMPILNIALRGGALAGRFVLMLYLVKIFTFEQIGLFGLIVALLASAPAVVGWGLNYFVNRDLVGQPRLLAGQMIRDRLTVTLASAGLVGLLLLLVQLGGFYSLSFALLLLIMGLLVVEMLAYDLHYHLLSLKQPLLANAVMFIRTAAWVAPFVALSWWLPTLQNLTSLLAAWLMGGLLALITLAYAFRGWPLKAIWQQPIDRAWLKEKLGQNKLIYLNDLSFVVMGFFDRFVIEHSLGLAATGIYVMYWQMANAVYLLASTGSLQIEAPKLIQAWKDQQPELWRSIFWRMLKTASAVAVAIALGMAVLFPLVLEYLGKGDALAYVGIFWLLLAAICCRVIFDCLGHALTSQKQDSLFAYTSLLGMLLTMLSILLGLTLNGLQGVALALIISMGITTLVRLKMLQRVSW